jgi:beta-xylosidase
MESLLKKFTVLVSIFVIGVCTGNSQSISFKTYMNPVIPGDHPDCTVTQIGNDFYTTGSSFNVTPVIYHSTDLVHWRAIAQPVSASWTNYGDTPGGGCWGGQMVFYNNKYWDFFSRSNTMYFVTADKPEGPWSMPTKVNNPSQLPYGLGYDNSIFIDDNGKWYLVVKNGQPNNGIVELGNNGQPTGVVYNLSWLNPAPSYPYSWAEGPVMWKYNGYYYYSFARDLAGGQKVMRSATLTADQASWTMLGDLFNESDPLKPGSLFTGPNHSSAAVMLTDSTHWVIHPLYAKGEWKGQGRQGLLNQVRYDSNNKPTADYPVNRYFTAPNLPSSGIPWMVPKSDFFNSAALNPEWSLLGYTPSDKVSLTSRPGWLFLSPKTNKMNTVTKNDGEHNYSLITRVEFDAKTTTDEAGLIILRGDEKMFVKLASTRNDGGHKIISFSFDTKRYETENFIGNTVWLKIIRINHSVSGYYSSNGIDWTQVGQSADISAIDSYSDFSSFTGTRQGLYVQNSNAYFDLYIYRDAYTSILAESPANQYGTIRTSLSQGIYLLDSIHNNDWALYAGVEFGDKDYPKACDSVQFIASSATSGGSIEVWLDSIDTGTKIATCNITNTSSWSTFKTFTVKTARIKGRHDVYLKFTGSGPGRLLQLKWINFIPVLGPKYVSSSTSVDGYRLEARFDKALKIPITPLGFSVFINDTVNMPITDILISPKDSLTLFLIMQSALTKDDRIAIAYSDGNIISKDSMNLVQFYDTLVINKIYGSHPKIQRITTNPSGDSLFLWCTKNMNSPDTSFNKFSLLVNKTNALSAVSASLTSNDSAKIILKFSGKVYYEDELALNYSGVDVKSADNGILQPINNMPVTNFSDGYPLILTSAILRKVGTSYNMVALKFDKSVVSYSGQLMYFGIKINGTPISLYSINGASDSIRFSFNSEAKYGDTILLSFADGVLKTKYNGKLANIADYPVINTVPLQVQIKDIGHNKIAIYPNPVKDQITVTSDSNFDEIRMYSTFGREVFSQRFNSTNYYTISNLKLINGFYILQVKGNNTKTISKVLVE